jgi:crossover junction endodeoxyribonuclease RusA
MMNSITITLPLPDKSLSPNARVHWRKKSVAVKAYRQTAWIAAFKASNGRSLHWQKARYKAVFYWPNARCRDPDNAIASIKSALDGIADAGVVINDSVLWPERPEFHTDTENPRLELTITSEP